MLGEGVFLPVVARAHAHWEWAPPCPRPCPTSGLGPGRPSRPPDPGPHRNILSFGSDLDACFPNRRSCGSQWHGTALKIFVAWLVLACTWSLQPRERPWRSTAACRASNRLACCDKVLATERSPCGAWPLNARKPRVSTLRPHGVERPGPLVTPGRASRASWTPLKDLGRDMTELLRLGHADHQFCGTSAALRRLHPGSLRAGTVLNRSWSDTQQE